MRRHRAAPCAKKRPRTQLSTNELVAALFLGQAKQLIGGHCAYRTGKFISFSKLCAPSTASITHSMYTASTWIDRVMLGSKMKSLPRDSYVPSNSSPHSSPLALSVGEPELPPVVSTSDKKSTGTAP